MLSRTTTTTARWLISSQRPAAAAASRSASVININCQQQRCLNVASKPSDLVGNTPLIDLNKILVAHGVDGKSVLAIVTVVRYLTTGL